MLEGIFSQRTWQAIEHGLSALSLRQSVLADNVANAETPGFKRSDVEFTSELQRYLEAMQSNRPVEPFQPRVRTETGTSQRVDGNNVDIEMEMVRLAENQLIYEALLRHTGDRIGMLRSVMTEGRR